MSELTKGNFDVKKKVKIKHKEDDDDDGFESSVLEQLGGSIAFVREGKLIDTNE